MKTVVQQAMPLAATLGYDDILFRGADWLNVTLGKDYVGEHLSLDLWESDNGKILAEFKYIPSDTMTIVSSGTFSWPHPRPYIFEDPIRKIAELWAGRRK